MAQPGSAPRSHRGGQEFKSPQVPHQRIGVSREIWEPQYFFAVLLHMTARRDHCVCHADGPATSAPMFGHLRHLRAAAACAVVAGVLAVSATTAAGSTWPPTPRFRSPEQLEALVHEPGGPPGVIATFARQGASNVYRAGVADLATGRPPKPAGLHADRQCRQGLQRGRGALAGGPRNTRTRRHHRAPAALPAGVGAR